MTKRVHWSRFKVGLLGESPNDTKAVVKLLNLRYAGRVEFVTLIEGVTGDNLEDEGAFKLLRREYDYERPDLVIAIRDLDGLEDNATQKRKRRAYFKKVEQRLGGRQQEVSRSLPLLNIYTIEALIAAHIQVFNDYYTKDGCQCECVIEGDVMKIEKPIELLREATKGCKMQYQESHCGELLAKVSYEMLLANCRYFQAFDTAFAARLPT
jgi:hypothetical protein